MESDYLLVVGEGRIADRTARALSVSDHVKRCLGSAAVPCPAVHRERCALRSEAAAAVVFLAGEHEFHTPGQWSCVIASTTPAVAVLEGSSVPVRGSTGFAVVGSKGGPAAIVEAINAAADPGASD